MKTPQRIKDGEPVIVKYTRCSGVKIGEMHFACCDCGLVHKFIIEPLKSRVRMYFWRDKMATKEMRIQRRKRFLEVGKA